MKCSKCQSPVPPAARYGTCKKCREIPCRVCGVRFMPHDNKLKGLCSFCKHKREHLAKSMYETTL